MYKFALMIQDTGGGSIYQPAHLTPLSPISICVGRIVIGMNMQMSENNVRSTF